MNRIESRVITNKWYQSAGITPACCWICPFLAFFLPFHCQTAPSVCQSSRMHCLRYNSFQIQPVMHMVKCIILLTHPITLVFPWIQNCKRRMPCGTKIIACVSPIISMCLHAPFPLQFSLVFISLAPLLNIYFILIFENHLLSPLLKFQMYPSNLGNY